MVSILVPAAVLDYFLSSRVIPHAATSAHFPPEQTTMVAGSWSMTAAMAREFQREYCIRHYMDENRRDDMLKVVFRAPGTRISYDFFIYKEGDIVSNDIQAMGSYEGGLLEEMKRGMPSKYFDVVREKVYFIDTGGNIGTHTLGRP
jgi:hypothetical protein